MLEEQKLIELINKANSLNKELNNNSLNEKTLAILISSLSNEIIQESHKNQPDWNLVNFLNKQHSNMLILKMKLANLKEQTTITEAKIQLDELINISIDANYTNSFEPIITSIFEKIENIIINFVLRKDKNIDLFNINEGLNSYFYRTYYGIVDSFHPFFSEINELNEEGIRNEFIQKSKINKFENFESVYNYLQFLLQKLYPEVDKDNFNKVFQSDTKSNLVFEFFNEIKNCDYDTFVRSYVVDIDPKVEVIMQHRDEKERAKYTLNR